ncbi:CU044_5270 family protein [Streptomyces sp. KLOTTS4A1]|uniref:CU044_5270 family protein n=1 Tax=Streptomyces sp. KLOTTS4A1 TaxID=3390996 RepID=UPI0039F5C93C
MNAFPSLPERDLPEGRRHLLKEHLLNEIRQDAIRQNENRHGEIRHGEIRHGGNRHEGTRPEPRSRAKWLRPAFTGPALAGALTLAVLGGLALAGGDPGEGGLATGGGTGGTVVDPDAPRVEAGAPASAAQLLDRVATVAARQDFGVIRDDQYVYVKTKAAYTAAELCEAPRLEDPALREVWFAVDGTRPGVLRSEGSGARAASLDAPTPGIPSNTYYRHLETLPTDPEKMLDWLHKASEGGKSEDQNTFVLVGDLVRESLVPPKVAAALYRAAGKIDGVTLVPNATDAIGRKGVAVGRVDEESGVRDEWIFDAETYEYLGERGVTTRGTEGVIVQQPGGPEQQCSGMPAGQVTANTAVLERKVVDTAPEVPGRKKTDSNG